MMLTRHTRGKITWIDLESPAPEELHNVMLEFGISPHIEEEIVCPTPYPLVISFPNYVYLVLHFPAAGGASGARSQEVDFIVGKEFIITVRYELVDSIMNLHKVFEAEDLLGLPETASEARELIVEQVFRRLFHAIREELEATGLALERVETGIFTGKERAMVRKISEIGRVLLRFETVLGRSAEPLSTFLEELGKPAFFGPAFAIRAESILSERTHAAALAASLRAVAAELRLTNDSLLTSSQNSVMKTLTVVTFIMFPLSFVTAVLTVPAGADSIIYHHEFLWIVLGLMGIIAAGLFVFAKFKRWF